MTNSVVLFKAADGVAVVIMNRPQARNALSRQMLRELRQAVGEADDDPEIGAIVLTGADPAFCAGLDLKELGADGGVLNEPRPERTATKDSPATTRARVDGVGGRGRTSPLATDKPVIGAVNGPAVTGGLELALNCDFLVASERARFADTHARIGVQPLWGLTVLLPEAVGLRRAREMSATGNFVDAGTALAWGLVNHVVPHEDLLPFARKLAADVAGNDRRALAHLLDTYHRGSLVTRGEAWPVEAEAAAAFHGGRTVDPADIERRRGAVTERGSRQV